MLRALPVLCLLITPAYATEAPCDIPSCLGSQITAIGKERVVLASADGKLEVRIVAAVFRDVVLVEVVRDKVPAKIREAFVIAKGAGVELVPLGGDLKKPMMVFGGSWHTSASKLDGIDIKPTNAKVDGRALLARYRKQERAEYAEGQKDHAKRQLDDSLAELNQACGTAITATQDFSRVPDRWFETSMRDAAYVCEDNFHAFVLDRCQTAAGKQAIAQKLKAIRCIYKPTGGLGIKLASGTLTIELSLSANRERQGSQAHRYLQPKL